MRREHAPPRNADTDGTDKAAVPEPGRINLVARAALFWVGMALSTLVFWMGGMLALVLSFEARFNVIVRWCRFNLWWLKLTCGLDYQVEGLEHIPPANGIVLSKHQSAWETLVLALLFRPPAWVVKRELLWVPFFGWGLAALAPIAINRGASRKALQQLLDQGTRALSKGRWVIIFPEGTRVAPGEKRRYQSGGARLAAASGYPVVPVAHNAGRFWPRRSFIKHPGTIRLCIGPVIQSTGRSPEEINAAAEAWIEGKMQELDAAGQYATARDKK